MNLLYLRLSSTPWLKEAIAKMVEKQEVIKFCAALNY